MIEVLYEDQDIIVVNKTANMPSQKDLSRTPDVLTLVNQHTKSACHLIHRLDRHVAGPLVLAKNKQSAATLNKQLRVSDLTEGEGFSKEYMATVVIAPMSPVVNVSTEVWTTLEHYQRKVGTMAETISIEAYQALKPDRQKEYKKALLKYEVLECRQRLGDTILLLKIDLLTGRFHQIRSQLAAAGLPIAGDPKYGVTIFGTEPAIKKIGLQSTRLEFLHPKHNKKMVFSVRHREEPFDWFNL